MYTYIHIYKFINIFRDMYQIYTHTCAYIHIYIHTQQIHEGTSTFVSRWTLNANVWLCVCVRAHMRRCIDTHDKYVYLRTNANTHIMKPSITFICNTLACCCAKFSIVVLHVSSPSSSCTHGGEDEEANNFFTLPALFGIVQSCSIPLPGMSELWVL